MTQHAFYLYPSTLRMINIDDNPEYNKVVENIDRLMLVSAWPDRLTLHVQDSLQQALEEEEGFEVMVEVDNNDYSLVLLSQEDGEQTVAFLRSEEMTGVAHLLGTLNLLAVNDLFQKMDAAEADENGSDLKGVKMLWNMAVRDQQGAITRKKEREKWRKKRAAEKERRDSIQNAE